jgi:hypothetical protein
MRASHRSIGWCLGICAFDGREGPGWSHGMRSVGPMPNQAVRAFFPTHASLDLFDQLRSGGSESKPQPCPTNPAMEYTDSWQFTLGLWAGHHAVSCKSRSNTTASLKPVMMRPDVLWWSRVVGRLGYLDDRDSTGRRGSSASSVLVSAAGGPTWRVCAAMP